MIAKDCGTGKSFLGLASYLVTGKGGEQPERVTWSKGLNLATDDIKSAACIMRSTANDNTRVDKPVYHFSINFHPGEFEPKDQARALQIVSATLDDLGLADHQALAVGHHDTDHFHVHVMVNRIHPEHGRSWKQGLSKIALEKTMARLSLEHGFEIVPGRHNAEDLGLERVEADLTMPSEAQRYEERTGADSALARAREQLADAIRDATGWKDLEERLRPLGYGLEPRGRGLVFIDCEGVAIKASAVDRDFSRGALAARFGEDLAAEAAPPTSGASGAEQARGGGGASTETAAKAARAVLEGAGSWSELEKGLYAAGYVLQAKGRGLVIIDGDNEVKLSAVDRRCSKHGLEKRFGQRFSEHARTGARPTLPSAAARKRGSELDQAVRDLQQFERRTARLMTLLTEREQVLRGTQPTMDQLREIKQLREAADRAFVRHYRAPVKAKAKFVRFARKNGAAKAAAELAGNPGRFGSLAGSRLLARSDVQRTAAIKGLAEAGRGLQRASTINLALRRNAAFVDRCKALRNTWTNHKGLADLGAVVGSNARENMNQRIALERAVVEAARGLKADELETLPIGSKLRRAVVTKAVQDLRQERAARLEGRDPRQPMPPITATPKQQAAFEAAREYAKARQDFWRYAYNLDRKNHRRPDAFQRLDATANAILERHPEAMNHLSRFGLSRRDVIKDSSLSRTKSAPKNISRSLRRVRARLQGVGQGVSLGLSLFRRQ